MAQDFRRGAGKVTPRRSQRPRSCVWWFLFGGVVGSFGVGLYWMTQAPDQLPTPVAAIPKTERPAAPQPNFQFEKILRETVVDTTDSGKPPPPPAPRPEPPKPESPRAELAGPESPKPNPPVADGSKPNTAPVAASGTSVLQVGSFKTAKDAEAMKAKLALLGVSTRVQPVTLGNGQVWHRVMTGPLSNKKALTETQATLKKHGIEAMAAKVK